MKLLLYFVGLLFLTACTKRDHSEINNCCAPPPQQTEIVLKYQQSLDIYKCLENVYSIQFTSVKEDSRCALQAECVWKGTAKIGISINQSTPVIVELEKSINYNWNGFDYKITFFKLEPYPITPGAININTYKAHLRIERL